MELVRLTSPSLLILKLVMAVLVRKIAIYLYAFHHRYYNTFPTVSVMDYGPVG